jgi:outer membrane protein TolC
MLQFRPVLLLALASAGLAQDTTPLQLTLRGAVNLALKQNPQVIIANLGVAMSQEESKIARSALLPQASGNVSESVLRSNIVTFVGTTIPGFAQHVGPIYVSQAGVNFNGAVWDLTLWHRFRESRYGIDSSRAQEITVREQSVLLVVSQYLGSMRAAADVQAAQSRVDLAQALYNQAADLQRNGVGTGIDTLRANVQLQNETQRLIVAQTQLQTSLYGLARLLNVNPSRTIELADSMSFFETPPAAPEQTLDRAFATRPELRRLVAEEHRAELQRQSANDQRLPRFSIGGYWAEQGLSPISAIPVYEYRGSADFPLFTGGRIEAQRAEADLALRQIKQQEQDVRNQIALEVRTAAAQVDASRHEVDVANLGVQLARQEVEQARDRFQAGVANIIEVITAQDELSRANDNQIAALYRYNQARADLAHSAGQMETLYAR